MRNCPKAASSLKTVELNAYNSNTEAEVKSADAYLSHKQLSSHAYFHILNEEQCKLALLSRDYHFIYYKVKFPSLYTVALFYLLSYFNRSQT